MPAQTSIDNPLPVMLVSGGVAVTTTTQAPVTPGTATATAGLLLAGRHLTTLPTFTDTQQGALVVGTRGSLNVTLFPKDTTSAFVALTDNADASAASSNNMVATVSRNVVFNGTTWDRARGDTTGTYTVEQASTVGGATYLNVVAGQATTVVKASAGKLYRIIFNSVPTATGTLIIYDHASGAGTIIGKYTAPAAPTPGPVVLDYGPAGINCATGITLISATANSADLTVVFK